MVSGIWGKKIGMTQLFSGDKVVPVTAINVGNWIVTGIKTKERDGYNAIQVGCPRKRYLDQKAVVSWMKKPQQYFSVIREIRVADLPENLAIGQRADFNTQLQEGEQVDVFGTTKGKTTGSIGFLRSQGKVIKGKRMPGHMGVQRLAVKNLNIVKIAEDAPIVFVKGAIPGHAGSLVFIQRQVK